jgi:hypothetical protein
MTILAESTFLDPAELFISLTFQNILVRCVTKKRYATFARISFEGQQNGT